MARERSECGSHESIIDICADLLVIDSGFARRQPGIRNDAYTCRSTSARLISAMAFAGLRCLGQALAQFMMVWQR